MYNQPFAGGREADAEREMQDTLAEYERERQEREFEINYGIDNEPIEEK